MNVLLLIGLSVAAIALIVIIDKCETFHTARSKQV